MAKFNPLKDNLVKQGDHLHVNNVYVKNGKILFSGTNMRHFFTIDDDAIRRYTKIPGRTHNCKIFDRNHIIYNDTASDRIVLVKNNGQIVKYYNIKKIPKNKMIESNVSKQPFGRGLAIKGNWIVGGSTPGMISLYDLRKNNKNISNVLLSNYASISIHGLEIWPYQV